MVITMGKVRKVDNNVCYSAAGVGRGKRKTKEILRNKIVSLELAYMLYHFRYWDALCTLLPTLLIQFCHVRAPWAGIQPS